MFGSTRFRWVRGGYTHDGTLKTTGLALSEADADVGTLQVGLMMRIKASDPTLMDHATGAGYGLLTRQVNLDGTTGLQGFKDFTIGKLDLPRTRGSVVALRVPDPGSIAEFEGTGAAAYNNLVITATTTGFLSNATTKLSPLTVTKGGWRIAQAGEMVLAHLLDPALTPENAGELRIRIQFCGQYVQFAS